MKFFALPSLEARNPRFRTRGVVKFQLIVFGFFAPLEAVLAVTNAFQRDWWAAAGFAFATSMFGFFLIYSIAQGRSLASGIAKPPAGASPQSPG